jgi:hypothetical protein
MSTNGSICPSCAKDVGVWSIMRSPLPNISFRCPHCRVALKYTPAQWGFICMLLLLCIPVVVVVAAATRYLLGITILAAVVYFAVMLALWLPFELAIARRQRARSQLSLK